MVWYLLEVGWRRILWGFFFWWESCFWKCQSRAWWVDGGPLVWNDKHSALKLREFFIVWNLKWPHFRAEHHILAHSLPNALLYFTPFVQINSNWKAVNPHAIKLLLTHGPKLNQTRQFKLGLCTLTPFHCLSWFMQLYYFQELISLF